MEVDDAWLAEVSALQLHGALQAHAEPQHTRLNQQEAEGLAKRSLLLEEQAERRAEHAALEGAEPVKPAPATWRSPRARDGAPLYMLCDFGALAPAHHAALEGALEAAGLLDAWVSPAGQMLSPDTFDTLLAPAPLAGATLADVLVPVSRDGVSEAAIVALLRSVQWCEHGELSASAVAADGRFKLGPLEGCYRKEVSTFIGVGSRERERARRLAEIVAELARLGAQLAEVDSALTALAGARLTLQQELKALPPAQAIIATQASRESAQRQLGEQRRRLDEALSAVQEAESMLAQQRDKRDAAAAEAGLGGWVDRLDALRRLGASYRERAMDWLRECDTERAQRAQLGALEEQLQRVCRYRDEEAAAAAEATHALARAQARVQALREAIGSTRDELLAELHAAESERTRVRRRLSACQGEHLLAVQAQGAAQATLAAREGEVQSADTERRGAEDVLRRLLERDLPFPDEIPSLERVATWSYTDLLQAARMLDAATAALDPSQAQQDKQMNRLVERKQEVERALLPDIRLGLDYEDGVLLCRAERSGRVLGLRALLEELKLELDERERLLGDEEAAVFENFLSGEVHDHVASRLRDARKLVERMNAQLLAHPTSSGMTLRLRWQVGDDAPAGARDAIQLFLRSGHLLADTDTASLRKFLQQRLHEAHDADAVLPLRERMIDVLDYRRWHGFSIEYRTAQADWRLLTKKLFGTGSGGQKAVMLHLPLFAAAAAFYDSAQAHAPRIVALDEAFAGIDGDTRGELMGLLCDFDLDAIMTSFEEWGFYPKVNGLSTYHLSRQPGLRSVHTDWFVWDGVQARRACDHAGVGPTPRSRAGR